MKYLPCSFLIAVAGLGSGCSSHSIREGVWELSFHAKDYVDQQPVDEWFPENPRRVRVSVDWASEHAGEDVTIEALDTSSSRRLKMDGDILNEGKVVRIRQTDDDYVFDMQGEILGPTRIAGRKFVARYRFEENTAFVGRWEMTWVGD